MPSCATSFARGSNAYQAENKYLQMERATEVGFLIPKVIVSNQRDVLVKFAEDNGDVVLKLMNQEFYKDSDGVFKGLYVNKVSVADLLGFKRTEENPVVLQSYINKAYEVRYTVVGETHLVCRIESQMSDVAKVDWRRYDIPNTPHYPMDPPAEIKEKVTKFMQSLGLQFGAMDFIVTPDNLWYFLEINTMGQWLWIEDLTGLNISGAIVRFLSTTKRESDGSLCNKIP